MQTTKSNQQPQHSQLRLNLGETVSDRLQYVSKIKHAMCLAMMLHIENGMADDKNPSLEIFSSIYLEANFLEDQLRKI